MRMCALRVWLGTGISLRLAFWAAAPSPRATAAVWAAASSAAPATKLGARRCPRCAQTMGKKTQLGAVADARAVHLVLGALGSVYKAEV